MSKMISVCLIVTMVLLGCVNNDLQVLLHQKQEFVIKIELLSTSNNSEHILYTLKDAEIPSFWSELSAIRAGRYFNDPATTYGDYSIKVYYSNEYIDIIGMDINCYLDPNGNQVSGSGWYYVADDDAFMDLFFRYII